MRGGRRQEAGTRKRQRGLCGLRDGRAVARLISTIGMRCLLQAAFSFLLTASFLVPVYAQPGAPGPSSPLYGARPETGPVASGLPKALQEVGIDQKLNDQLPLDLVFRNERGESVKLGDYFGKKPVVLSLVYYECPMLCTQVLNGMVKALQSSCIQSRIGV